MNQKNEPIQRRSGISGLDRPLKNTSLRSPRCARFAPQEAYSLRSPFGCYLRCTPVPAESKDVGVCLQTKVFPHSTKTPSLASKTLARAPLLCASGQATLLPSVVKGRFTTEDTEITEERRFFSVNSVPSVVNEGLVSALSVKRQASSVWRPQRGKKNGRRGRRPEGGSRSLPWEGRLQESSMTPGDDRMSAISFVGSRRSLTVDTEYGEEGREPSALDWEI